MPDEGLIAALHFIGQCGQRSGVLGGILEMSRIQIGMRAILMGEVIGPLGAERDFYSLDAVEQQKAQLAVKDIKVESMLEACPVFKDMLLGIAFEREEPVGA